MSHVLKNQGAAASTENRLFIPECGLVKGHCQLTQSVSWSGTGSAKVNSVLWEASIKTATQIYW
jgi:hypothetical protein